MGARADDAAARDGAGPGDRAVPLRADPGGGRPGLVDPGPGPAGPRGRRGASTPTRPGAGCGSPATRWTGGSGRGGAAGSTRWCPARASPRPRLPVEVVEMAVALKRENPARTARRSGGSCAPRWGGRRASGPCNASSPTTRRSPTWCAAGAAGAGVRPVRGRRGPTSCGPATPCTARTSAAARPTCSPSSTTTPGRSWGTGSGSPRTPCAWPPRCAPRSARAGSPTGSTSTTARRSSTPGCCAPAPSSASG